MILYYSGTGNSAYAANFTSRVIGDEVINLFDKIRAKDHSAMTSEKPWVIATPIYCWQLPHIVRDWMMATEFQGSRDIYFIITCGDSIGNAQKYLKKLCSEKNLNYMGCAEIVMPENYIALFKAPDEEKAERIISNAERNLKRTASLIAENRPLPEVKVNFADRIKSSIVNIGYYPMIVKDKKFYAKSSCIGCGLCVKKCPLGNISLSTEGRPVWSGHCTHCMACISHCPKEAIEYGKASRGKRRYTCPR